MRRQKRSAVALILLVIVDYIHCHAAYLDHERVRTDHTLNDDSKAAVTMPTNALPDDTTNQNNYWASGGETFVAGTSSLLSTNESGSSSAQNIFAYLAARVGSVRQLSGSAAAAGSNATSSCDDLIARNFSQRIKDVPLAAELYGLSTTLALQTYGCNREAEKQFSRLQDSMADNNLLVQLIESISTVLDMDVKSNETDHVPGNSSNLMKLMSTVEQDIQILQARSHDRPSGQLRCQWTRRSTGTYKTCQRNDAAVVNVGPTLNAPHLISAKLLCEKQDSECDIVIEASHEGRQNLKYIISSNNMPEPCFDQSYTIISIWVKKQCDVSSDTGRPRGPQVVKHAISKRDASAAHQIEASAILYKDSGFSGGSKVVKGSVDVLPDEWDEQVSSVSCLEVPCTIIVFEHANYSGRQMSYENSTAFVGERLNDLISSLVVVPFSIGQLCYSVFSLQNFAGQSRKFCGDQDLTGTVWNKKVHSIRLHCVECSAIVHDLVYDGGFAAFSASVANVGSYWKSSIASVQVRPWTYDGYEGEFSPVVRLYEHRNYAGLSLATYEMLDSIQQPLTKSVSSFDCYLPCTVILFEGENFTGNSRLFDGSQSNLDDFDNKTSSVVLFNEHYCVRFYEGKIMSGASLRFCADVASLSQISSGNIGFYSLSVECSQCSVAVYDEENFNGREAVFRGNVSDVGRHWYTFIKSFQIRPWQIATDSDSSAGNTYVISYADANFQGRAKVVTAAHDYIGDEFNDQVSSVYCEVADCTFLVFEHRNYEGESVLYSGSQTSLSAFNDKISSMAILPHSLCVRFYEHHNYGGNSVRYCQDVTDVGDYWDNKFSSVIIECKDCSVVIYEHAQYGGEHKAFSNSSSSMSGQRWNDMASSIQIRPGVLDFESVVHNERGSCLDAKEQKAYDVIQWIPAVSLVYSLGSSIYYGSIGCHSAAQQRAIDMAIDVGINAVVIMTAGAAGGLALGIKTGVKVGLKAGIKAATKAAVAVAVKSTASGGIKNFVTKLGTKSFARAAAKSAGLLSMKSIGSKALKSVPRVVRSQKRTGGGIISWASYGGLGGTPKRIGSGIDSSAKKKIDDLAGKAQTQIDVDTKAKARPAVNVDAIRRGRRAADDEPVDELRRKYTEDVDRP